MFDIGFSELVLVGIIALIVFGPERLPRVAREVAMWLRRARSAVASVKAEIDHELQIQDMKESLAKEKARWKSLPTKLDVEPAPVEPVEAVVPEEQPASEEPAEEAKHGKD